MDVPISTGTALATRDELFSANEQLALAGFLAGYSGLTRDAYSLDLRQYVAWCTEHRLAVFGARRADIECFARHLESLGRARATIARRLCTVACFYRYAEQEGLISVSPAAHVRRPRLDYESHPTSLDRNEVGALLVAAGLAGGRDHALISLLALNGAHRHRGRAVPMVKRQNDGAALGYVRGRLPEAAVIVVGIVSVVSVVTLRRDVAGATGTDAGSLVTVRTSLVAIHDWTFLFGHSLVLGANTLLLAYLAWIHQLRRPVPASWSATYRGARFWWLC